MSIDIEKTAAIISIFTPVVLLIWFAITRKSHLAETYYKELIGN